MNHLRPRTIAILGAYGVSAILAYFVYSESGRTRDAIETHQHTAFSYEPYGPTPDEVPRPKIKNLSKYKNSYVHFGQIEFKIMYFTTPASDKFHTSGEGKASAYWMGEGVTKEEIELAVKDRSDLLIRCPISADRVGGSTRRIDDLFPQHFVLAARNPRYQRYTGEQADTIRQFTEDPILTFDTEQLSWTLRVRARKPEGPTVGDGWEVGVCRVDVVLAPRPTD